MATSIIRVYDKNLGQWKQDAKVVLGWDGFINSGMSNTEYTDKEGTAIINHSATGEATIYVNGRKTGKIYTPGSTTVQI